MGKLRGTYRPDWSRTNASQEQRTAVWSLAAQGYQLAEIQKTLQLQEMDLDRKTISQIIKEAIGEPGVPAEVVKDLDPVIRQWIRSKRTQPEDGASLPEHPVLSKPESSEESSEVSDGPPQADRFRWLVAQYGRQNEQYESRQWEFPLPGTVSERTRTALPTLKGRLTVLLFEGRRLEKQCLDEGRPLPIAPAENWRKRTRALLEEQTAQYIADIWDEPGFDPLPDASVQERPSSAKHRELWMPIAARVRRLENILKGF